MVIKELFNSLLFYLSTLDFVHNHVIGRILLFYVLFLKRLFMSWTGIRSKLEDLIKIKHLPKIVYVKQPFLYAAIRLNDLDVVKHLVATKPDNINIALTKSGSTPLHVSALTGSEEICHFLLQNGANVNACDVDGFTPLFFIYDEDKVEIARILIQNGANISAQVDTKGWTLLHYAAFDNLPEITKVLLENGAEVDAADSNGTTPLHISTGKGNTEVAKMLMQNGANVNALTNDGFCPLRIAAQENHVAIAESLIRHGADTEIGSVISQTPLLEAAHGNLCEGFG